MQASIANHTRSRLTSWRSKRLCGMGLSIALGVLAAALPPPVRAEPGPTLMATGSYVGDGGNSHPITGLSFRPDFVIVKHDGADGAIAKHRDMPGGMSKHLNGDWSFYSNRILSLEVDGFTVGSDQDVNDSGGMYYWVAFRESDEFALGTYTGNGSSGRDITGLGLDPVYVVVLADGRLPWQSSREMTGGISLPFNTSSSSTNRITDMVPDGFEVGSSSDVNAAGQTYYYLAFSESSGRQSVNDYWGNGSDPYDLTGLGFEPEYVLIKGSSTEAGVQRPAALAGDRTLYFVQSSGFSNGIQALLPDGFQLGDASTVNQSSHRYYWFAARSEPYTNIFVGLTVDDATPVEGQEIVFRTGLMNFGPADANDVQISVPLPPGLEFVSALPEAGNYDEGTGIWSIPTLPDQSILLLDIRAAVGAGTAGSTLATTATLAALDIMDGIAADDSSTVPITVQGADLDLDIIVDNAFPQEGEQVEFGIMVTNLGPDPASGVEVDAALVPGLSYVTHNAGQGSYLPGSGLWQVGPLDVGESTSLLLTASVDAGTLGSMLLQTASRAASSPMDPVSDNDVCGVTLTVSDLVESILMTVADTYIDEKNPGDNKGDADVTKVKNKPDEDRHSLFRFDLASLPVESPIVRAVLELWVKKADVTGDPVLIHRVTGDWDEMSLSWSSFSAAYDPAIEAAFTPLTTGPILIDITTLVLAWQEGAQPNFGLLLEASSDDDESQYYSREDADVNHHPHLHVTSAGTADLGLALAVDDANPDEGQLLTFTAVLSNAGPNGASGIEATHSPPPELTHQGATVTSGSYDAGSGLWSLGAQAVGTSDTLVVTALVNPGSGGTTALDSITVTASDQGDPTPADNVAGVALDIQLAELSVFQVVSDGRPAEGDTPVFTIKLRNAGPDTATGIVLRDSLPAGLSHVADLPSQGGYDSGTGLWSVGGVAAGDSATLELTVLVEAGTGGQELSNSAWIQASDQADHSPGDDSSALAITVQGADLALSKITDDAAPDEGDPVTYTLTLRNLGPDAAAGIGVDDLLPAGVTYGSDAPSQGSYDSGTGRWDVGAVAVGDSASLDLNVTVDAGTQGTTIVNHASIALSNLPDPLAANDADSALIAVSGTDLSISKRVDDPHPAELGLVSFTIVVENLGPDDATGIVVSDTLPSGLSYIGDAPEQGSYDLGTGLWNLGNLAAGDSLRLTLDAAADTGTGGSLLVNRSAIEIVDQHDPNPGNDTDTAEVLIQGADLAVRQSIADTYVDVGDTLQFHVVLENLGPDDAVSVGLTDVLVPGFDYVDATTSQGGYASGVGVWNVGAVAVGDSAVMDLRAAVAAGTAGASLENLAVAVNWASTDPVAANDSSRVDLTVSAVDLALTQVVGNESPNVGETVDIDLVLRNIGAEPASGIVVEDLLPAGLGHLGNTPEQGSYESATGLWTVGDLPTGNSLRLQIQARVLPGSGGQTLELLALVLAVDQEDTNAANDSSLASLGVPAADLSLDLTANTLRPEVGDTITLALGLENLGPDAASAVQISAAMPLGLEPLSFLASGGSYAPITGLWSLATLDAGASELLTIQARVSSGSGGENLPVSAFVLSQAEEDPDTGNDGSEITVTPRIADFGLTLWVSNEAPVAGVSFDALVRFINSGPDSAIRSLVDLSLPVELELLASLPEQGDFDAGAGLWDIGAVAPGDSIDLALTLRAAPDAGGASVLLSATASAGTEDPAPGDTQQEIAINIGTAPRTPIEIVADQTPGTLLPGATPQTLLSLSFHNRGLRTEQLTGLEILDASSGSGNQEQLDANWSTISLVSLQSPTDLDLFDDQGRASFSNGVLHLSGLNLAISPGDSLTLQLRGGASTVARDSDHLDLLIIEPAAISFAEPCSLIASWPMHPSGDFVVNGLSAAQLALDGDLPVSLLTGDTDMLALSLRLPPNGYETDTLRKFNVYNWGSALPGSDIAAMRFWTDNGDDLFDAAADTLVGELYATGMRWENSNLDLNVPLGGRRVFVSVDIAELASAGAGVSLGLPADPSDTAIGMESGNDGPVDLSLPGPILQVVTVDNRITLSSQTLPPVTVPPGAEQVPMITLLVGNSFDHTKLFTGLTLTNASTGAGDPAQLDAAWQSLRLWADDGDGLFDAAADTLLANSFFTNGRADFVDFELAVPAENQRRIFAIADISLDLAADGDALALHIAGVSDVIFADGTSAAANYPIDSGRILTVDGMVAAQIQNHGASVATVGPGEGPVLALDLTLPANGYAEDVLQHLKVVNRGNAGDEDLETVVLWTDDGNGQWDGDGGGDLLLSNLAWLDGSWQSALSSIPVLESGLRVYVTFTVSPSLGDSATVQLALPENGVTMASGNDGPNDGEVLNPELQLLSPSTLLSSIVITPAASILDQEVSVSMTVRNQSGESIPNLAPSLLAPVGDGDLVLVSGPVPDSLQLGAGAGGEFAWTYRAAAAGQVQLTGSCSGRGDESGLTHLSLGTASNMHNVYVASDSLSLHAAEAAPFFVNQGQEDVVPLHLTFSHAGGAGSSHAELLALVLTLTDEIGGGIIPSELFAEVRVREGGDVYLVKSALETVGDQVNLLLDEPVSIYPDEPVTLDIQVDIHQSAASPEFYIQIVDSLAIDAVDATSGAPVRIVREGQSFPVVAGPAHVGAPAEELRVSSAADSSRQAGPGQADVLLEVLTLENPGLPGVTADVRIAAFDLSLVDSIGTAILPPQTLLHSIRVVSDGTIHFERLLTPEDLGSLELVLSPLLDVVAGEVSTLMILGEIAAEAPSGTFRTRLEADGVVARDANSAQPVPANFQSPPLLGHPLRVEQGVEALMISLSSGAPDSAAVGARDLPLLAISLRHPGDPDNAPLRCAGLSLRFWDEARDSLAPGLYFERLEARWQGTPIAELGTLPGSGGSVYLPLPDPLILPGENLTLSLHGDLEATAPAGFLEVAVDGPGWGVFDLNTGEPVSVTPEFGSALPLLSGLMWLESAPRALAVGLDNLMPPVLAGDGSEVPCFELGLLNTAEAGAGAILVSGLTLRAAGQGRAAAPLGESVMILRAYQGETLWAESADLTADSLTALLLPLTALSVEPEQPLNLEIRAELRPGTSGGLRLGIDAGDVQVEQPDNPLLAIDVQALEGSVFPLWSLQGNFSPTDLAASYSNFPNPFAAGRAETTFTYFLAGEARVGLKVWSARGELVRVIVRDVLRESGIQQDDRWDGRNGRGLAVQSGVYLAELVVDYSEGGRHRLLRKVAVLR